MEIVPEQIRALRELSSLPASALPAGEELTSFVWNGITYIAPPAWSRAGFETLESGGQLHLLSSAELGRALSNYYKVVLPRLIQQLDLDYTVTIDHLTRPLLVAVGALDGSAVDLDRLLGEAEVTTLPFNRGRYASWHRENAGRLFARAVSLADVLRVMRARETARRELARAIRTSLAERGHGMPPTDERGDQRNAVRARGGDE